MKIEANTKVGSYIRFHRKAKNWTQVDLAEKVGVEQKHISRWECDQVVPTLETLRKIFTALGVELLVD